MLDLNRNEITTLLFRFRQITYVYKISMKNLIRLGLSIFVITLLSSCDKDVCYECNAISSGTTIVASFSICEGDDDGSGGTLTETQVNATIAGHEALGGTCTKK